MREIFPEFIRRLTEADIPIEGVRAYITQGDEHQILFMEFSRDVEIPEHSHGPQWGIVINGTIELTIEGEKKVYKKGDTYFIPEGAKHSANIKSGYADISVFGERKRYRPKKDAGTPLEIMELDHIVLTVKDVSATCDFYTRILGMKMVEIGAGRKALTFGKQKINIHEYGNEIEPHAARPVPGSSDICLITSTPITEIISRFNESGVVIEEGPVRRTGSRGPMTSMYFRDPDGNLIEVSNYG
ncbi:virulence protein [bacterium BMS3Abin07]|nr:virulence protein [bacterium BMS3Abin07]GBE32180.1 virulence protein [bacterium BMS3Bbin05]HDL20505.1 cupin domain-containing protein [Nitrospirota bacterium]HDO22362.1 cupin domain-containing protein [Nitrospirota bacterium]HDZ88665.1 cupin domain-containing protein [Nitrospirota bacterium]